MRAVVFDDAVGMVAEEGIALLRVDSLFGTRAVNAVARHNTPYACFALCKDRNDLVAKRVGACLKQLRRINDRRPRAKDALQPRDGAGSNRDFCSSRADLTYLHVRDA